MVLVALQCKRVFLGNVMRHFTCYRVSSIEVLQHITWTRSLLVAGIVCFVAGRMSDRHLCRTTHRHGHTKEVLQYSQTMGLLETRSRGSDERKPGIPAEPEVQTRHV